MGGRRLWICSCFLLFLWAGCTSPPPDGPETSVTLSPEHRVQARISEGQGPWVAWEDLVLEVYPEPVWLLGARVEVLNSDETPAALQLIDEVTISLVYPVEHSKAFTPERSGGGAQFRLSSKLHQVKLPENYGIPLWSNEPLSISVRWKNTDLYQKRGSVKAKVTIDFIRDTAVKKALIPVFPVQIFAAAPTGEAVHFGIPKSESLEFVPPLSKDAKSELFKDEFGHEFSREWPIVKDTEFALFSLDGEVKGLAANEGVFFTLYSYPSVEAVTIEHGQQKLQFKSPETTSTRSLVFEDSAKSTLRVDYTKPPSGTRAAALLMGYFLNSSFKKFPARFD